MIHRLEPDRHEVLDYSWPWLQWLRNEVSQDLFVYRHRETGRFVLCEWHDRESQTCGELEVFDDPTGMWPTGMMAPSVLKTVLKSQQRELNEMIARRRERESDERNRREVAMDERAKTCKWLRSKGMNEEAHNIERGHVSWTSPSDMDQDAAKEMADQMLHATRRM